MRNNSSNSKPTVETAEKRRKKSLLEELLGGIDENTVLLCFVSTERLEETVCIFLISSLILESLLNSHFYRKKASTVVEVTSGSALEV